MQKDDSKNISKSAATLPAAAAVNPAWTIERMFGKRHWVSAWVGALCDSDPKFLLHVIDQSPDYAHFICLARLGFQRHFGNLGAGECARMLRMHGKKEIMRKVHPHAPAGVIKSLKKLRKRPLAQENYARLLRMLKDKTMRKQIQHAKRVRKCMFKAHALMETLPEEFQVTDVFCALIGENRRRRFRRESVGERYDALHAHIEILRHLNIKLTREQIARETAGMGCMENLQAWFENRFECTAFPPPPWAGNARIKPVRSREELKKIAETFRNCVKGYISKASLGYSCFYVCAQHHALVETVKDAVFGWGTGEMSGVRNKKVPPHVKQEILREFRDAGIGPQIDLHL